MFGRNVIGLPPLPTLPIAPIYGDRFSASVDGSTFIGTLGVRYELPVQTSRFRPYLSGGLGMNHQSRICGSNRSASMRPPRAPGSRSTAGRGERPGLAAVLGRHGREVFPLSPIATSCGSAEE
jgi:hypothetical protein